MLLKELHWTAVLSLDAACQMCPAVENAHEDTAFYREYGINWYEFIYTDDNIDSLLDEWWKTVPIERKGELLLQAIEKHQNQLEFLRSVL